MEELGFDVGCCVFFVTRFLGCSVFSIAIGQQFRRMIYVPRYGPKVLKRLHSPEEQVTTSSK